MKAKNFLRYTLVFLAFAGAYAAYFMARKAGLEQAYLDATAQWPSIRNFSGGTVETVREIAGKFGALVGIGLGLIAWVVTLVLMGILKIVRLARFAATHVVVLLLVYGAYLAFAVELVHFETTHSAISLGIINYVGRPLFPAALTAVILAVVSYAVPAIVMAVRTRKSSGNPLKKVGEMISGNGPSAKMMILPFLISVPFILSGCALLGDLQELTCLFVPDASHCYQDGAVGSDDPTGCDKVEPPASFKGTGVNPPKDKCYLMIAQNTGDFDVCDRIKGGPGSYSKEECITTAAVENEDPSGCKRLKGAAFDSCKSSLGARITPDRLKEINEEVEAAKSAAGKDMDDEEAAKNLKALMAKQAGLFDFAPEGVKAAFFKSAREELMSEVDDEDVKSEIARQFVDFRNQNPNLSLNEQLKKMEEIRDRQETMKRIDDDVNALMDGLKEGASDFATENLEELYGDDIEEYQKVMAERGRKFLEENGGDRVKRGIENLEYYKGKYDKASEQYEAISAQIEKIKKVYDEVNEVYGKIDAINKLVAEGRLDVGKAKVLHGAVYLGKGLEYATGYVPVFGSTISTVSKEMFDATVKFATKRAERTTAIDKCIEDPEHCDPNNISAY